MGPLIAGIVVTYLSWRVILWIQVGMTVLSLVLSLLVLREGGSSPQLPKTTDDGHIILHMLRAFSPMNVYRVMRYPNVLLTVRSLAGVWREHS